MKVNQLCVALLAPMDFFFVGGASFENDYEEDHSDRRLYRSREAGLDHHSPRPIQAGRKRFQRFRGVAAAQRWRQAASGPKSASAATTMQS